jgi:hypothetical protein
VLGLSFPLPAACLFVSWLVLCFRPVVSYVWAAVVVAAVGYTGVQDPEAGYGLVHQFPFFLPVFLLLAELPGVPKARHRVAQAVWQLGQRHATAIVLAIGFITLCLWLIGLFFEREAELLYGLWVLVATVYAGKILWHFGGRVQVRRPTWKEMALLLCSSLLMVGFLEAASRVIFKDARFFVYGYMESWPRMAYRNAPNTTATFTGEDGHTFTYDHNAQGIRDRFFGPKEPGMYRVVCVGDSFTHGHGVDADQTYPKRLEEALNARDPDGAYEVVNHGTSGHGPWQHVFTVEEFVPKFAPDCLVLQIYTGNDLTDDLIPHKEVMRTYNKLSHLRWKWERTPGPWEFRFREASVLFRVLNSAWRHGPRQELRPWFAPWKRIDPGPPAARPYWAEPNLIESYYMLEKAWSEVEASIAQVAAWCMAREIPLVVLHIPDEYEMYRVPDVGWADQYFLGEPDCYDLDLTDKRMQEICARLDLPLVRMLPVFRDFALDSDPDDLRVYIPQNRHLSVTGNAFTGEVLADFLLTEVVSESV